MSTTKLEKFEEARDITFKQLLSNLDAYTGTLQSLCYAITSADSDFTRDHLTEQIEKTQELVDKTTEILYSMTVELFNIAYYIEEDDEQD